MPKTKTPPSPDDALLLRAGQAARILLVDPSTLNLLIARGDLPVVRLTPAGHRLFDYDEVRALCRRRKKQAQTIEKKHAALNGTPAIPTPTKEKAASHA